MNYFSIYDNCVRYYRVYKKCGYYNIEKEFEIVDISIRRNLKRVSFNIIKVDRNNNEVLHLHRRGKPALLVYKDNCISEIFFYRWDKYHRMNGPAVIIYNYYEYLEYYQNGELHRIGGPAIITLDKNRIINQIWYIYGEELSKEEYYENVLCI